jgi:hypothetical protein
VILSRSNLPIAIGRAIKQFGLHFNHFAAETGCNISLSELKTQYLPQKKLKKYLHEFISSW